MLNQVLQRNKKRLHYSSLRRAKLLPELLKNLNDFKKIQKIPKNFKRFQKIPKDSKMLKKQLAASS